MNKFAILSLSLAAAVWSLQATAAGDPVAGKQKSVTCAACHGADGNSTNPQFPRLAGQYPDYIVRALWEYKHGERQNPIMKNFAGSLSAQDREDLAAYFSSQKGLIQPEVTRRPME